MGRSDQDVFITKKIDENSDKNIINETIQTFSNDDPKIILAKQLNGYLDSVAQWTINCTYEAKDNEFKFSRKHQCQDAKIFN